MDRTEELYSFINTYTEEHELPNARIALRAARELMAGIVRTSGDFDSDKWETIANHMFLPCWEKGADVWVPTLVDGVSIWEDINGDRYLYPPVVVSE